MGRGDEQADGSGSTQIFDTTFCGSWAGAVWAGSYCATVDASCTDYVAKNPKAFADGYWLVVSTAPFLIYKVSWVQRRDRAPCGVVVPQHIELMLEV